MSTRPAVFDSAVKEEIREHYDKDASAYDSEDSIDVRPENDYLLWHFLRKCLRNRSKNLILDVGGGTGRVSIPLIDEGHDVIIFDLSRRMLEQARKKSKESKRDSNLQLVLGDA